MHPKFYLSQPVEAYNYDHSSDCAIWATALVNYWVTHAFKLANCNGFYFNACFGFIPKWNVVSFYDPIQSLHCSVYS